MRKKWSVLFIVAAFAILSGSPPVGAREKAPVIRVVGCHSMLGKVDSWAKEFLRSYPGPVIVVSGCDAAAGFKTLGKKDAELVVASRRITPQERDDVDRAGIDLKERRIARDAVCLLVNESLPVKRLSIPLIRGIFSGKHTRWSELGGPDIPIKPFAFDYRMHGNMEVFREKVLNNGAFASGTVIEKAPRDFFMKVATTEGAIGVASFFLYERMPLVAKGFSANLIAVAKTSDSPGIIPSPRTIEDGSYPVIVPIYFYWDGNRDNPNIEKFVDYCESQGMRTAGALRAREAKSR